MQYSGVTVLLSGLHDVGDCRKIGRQDSPYSLDIKITGAEIQSTGSHAAH